MKKLIRLNGKAILNLSDMQRSFDAPALCDQADAFLSFAKIHCLSLPAMCEGRTAAYVTKNFWFGVLEAMVNGTCAADADECFVTWAAELARKHAEPGIRKAELLADVYGEMADMMLPEKLDAILDNNGMDDLKALMLLAVCELCEMDAREQTFTTEEPAAETEIAACAGDKMIVLYSSNVQAEEIMAAASAGGTGNAYTRNDIRRSLAERMTPLPGAPDRFRPAAGRTKAASPDATFLVRWQEGGCGRENIYRMTGRRSAGDRAAA